MAAFRIDISGMDELEGKLRQLGEKAPDIAALALYEGAGVVADAVSKAVQGIATEPFKYAKGGKKRLPSPEEKAALSAAPHGIAKFRKRLKAVDTSVGYSQSGYVNVNFRHMNANARTNYKAVRFKGYSSTATSTLKFIKGTTGKDLGKGAQNQKPIGVIANSINSGTSFMQKQPFMRKAFTQSKGKAIAAIENKINEEIEKMNIE